MPPSDLSSTLVHLYEVTNGAGWYDRRGWLQGEPCVGGWFGVVCCPESHPILDRWPDGGCRQQDGNTLRYRHGFASLDPSDDDSDPEADADARLRRLERTRGVPGQPRQQDLPQDLQQDSQQQQGRGLTEEVLQLQPAAVSPAGCASGNSSGTSADYARCVVVAVQLGRNNLRGRINATLDGAAMARLRALDLAHNGLGGRLPQPSSDEGLLALRLEGNRFSYDEESLLYASAPPFQVVMPLPVGAYAPPPTRLSPQVRRRRLPRRDAVHGAAAALVSGLRRRLRAAALRPHQVMTPPPPPPPDRPPA